VAGLGLGASSAALSQGALSAVDHSRAGMATGTVNTMRQIGTAAGVAVLGAIFQHRSAAEMTSQLAGIPVPRGQVSAISDAVGSGAGVRVADSAPEAGRSALAAAARAATAAGINEILLGGALVAGIAAVIAFLVIRPQPTPSEPAVAEREPVLAAAAH
jgi:hypothetical protein